MADFLVGWASAANIGNQNGEEARTLNYSVYFQDDWKISRNLTLNLGIRWDYGSRHIVCGQPVSTAADIQEHQSRSGRSLRAGDPAARAGAESIPGLAAGHSL